LIGEADLPSQGQPLSEETIKQINEYVAANAESMNILTQAFSRTRCRYPIKRARHDNNLIEYASDHLHHIKPCSYLFLFECILHLDKGELDQSVSAFRKSVRVACSLDQEPLLLSQLVRVACLLTAMEVLKGILSCRPIPDITIKEIDSILDSIYSPRSMLRGFVGDRCVTYDLFDQMFIMGLREKPQLVWLKYYRPVIKALEADATYAELMKALNTATNDVKRIHGVMSADEFLPSFYASVVNGFNLEARHRAAKAALAVERYRLVHNVLPNQLSDLVPDFLTAVPMDPFDGASLRYKKLAKGYVIYSVGMDGKDDGGCKTAADEQANDVTFTIER
jgi:hypothetical protein